ncbi:chromosome segregation protein SMC [Candidatus Woesearchaeota archaeon]|nr:MAG: chromosome segregation protein SMC [Candidatus Woesearchaeota archaeon]
MTRITRLEMKGFKSFASKTELVLGEKFNCVLGPNGSGKSNILDAICFVLGKASAKGLRAEKSANLIYNGGKKRSPAKQGEVSIYFANTNNVFGNVGNELKITRIIKPTGQSTYKINDKTHTRQQILEILAKAKIDPDGHNIVLQGDIVHMADMTPEERRRVIEEIAGISIYEDKKEKALRELTRVEEKLNEAHIILTERESYLKELKAERDQAQRFKDLDQKLKRNKATLLDLKKQKKTNELDKHLATYQGYTEKITKAEEQIRKLREDIAKKKENVEAINKEVEEKGERDQVALHKEVEKLRLDIALGKQRIETLKQELFKLQERREELLRTNKELDSKIKIQEKSRKSIIDEIAKKEKEIEKLEKRIDEFKQKHHMEDAADLDSRIVAIDKEAEHIQEEISELREQQQNLLREQDRIEIKLSTLDEKISKVAKLAKEHKDQLQELKEKKARFKQTTLDLSKALNESSNIAAQLANARDKLLSKKEEHSKLKARTATIQEAATRNLAVKRILEQKKSIRGIHGTIAQLGSVKRDLASALEVAAGARMNAVVVENDKVAEQCIRYLKDNKLGVATFLPLNKITPPPPQQAPKSKGIIGRAVDLITYDKKYAKAFAYVFANTLIVESIPAARSIGIGTYRMVTKSGDLIERSGAMQGGFRNRKEGTGFQEKETQKELHAIEKELADIEAIIRKLEQKKQDQDELIERLRTLKAELEGEIIKQEKTLFIDSEDLDLNKEAKQKLLKEKETIAKELDKLADEISQKTRNLATLKIEKSNLREKLATMRNPRLLAELNTFQDKRQELKTEIVELRAQLKNAESEMANILGPEAQNIKKILKQHEKEREQFLTEQKTLQEQITKQERELKQKEQEEKKFFAQFKDLFNKRSKIAEEITKAENNIFQLQDQIRTLQAKANAINLDIARLKAEIAAIEEEAKPFDGVPRFEGKSEAVMTREINEFEKLLENFGAVNLKALEIYDKVSQEYDQLIKKKERLATEREDVLVMINEIDSRKKELFMRTYEVVSKNFSTIFGTLSTKGQAFFELEDKKDPFAGGLTLRVRLSTKRFMDIRSLSGGEKTLTALAFLFAVQEHEPASFYVLDEVDAALDKHNSEKLAKMIRAYADKAQYLIISHNDAIISEADNLYGVSMDSDGISKITTLQL